MNQLLSVFIFLLFLLSPLQSWGQSDGTKFTFHQDASSGIGTEGNIIGYSMLGLTITGSSGSNRVVTWEVADDIGTFTPINCINIVTLANSTQAVATSTIPVRFQCNVAGFKKFRAVVSGGTTGSVTVLGTGLTKTTVRASPGGDGGSGGTGGHIIHDESVALTGQPLEILNFLGAGITCVSNFGTNAIDCTVPTHQFLASDFDLTGDTVSIDYLNAQSATSTTKGFLTAADWVAFNAKQAPFTAGTGLAFSGSVLNVASEEAGFLKYGAAVDLSVGVGSGGKMQGMITGALQYTGYEPTPVLHTGFLSPFDFSLIAGACTGDPNFGKLTIVGTTIQCMPDVGIATGGTTGDVQYRLANGSLSGESTFNYSDTLNTLTIANLIATIGLTLPFNASHAGACANNSLMFDSDAPSGQGIYGCQGNAWVLQGDGTGAAGTVTISGSPSAGQYAKWISASAIEGITPTGTGAPVMSFGATITSPEGIVKADVGLSNVDNVSLAVERATPRTLTNARIIPRTYFAPNAATIGFDSALYDEIVVMELSQSTTFSIPTASIAPEQGQSLTFYIHSTLRRTLLFTTGTNGYANLHNIALPTVSDADGRQKFVFHWDSISNKWGYVGGTQSTTRGALDECYMGNGLDSEASFKPCAGGTGGGAPIGASYWTAASETGLSGEKNLGALADGSIIKISVVAGVATPLAAVPGTDFPSILTAVTAASPYTSGEVVVAGTGRATNTSGIVAANIITSAAVIPANAIPIGNGARGLTSSSILFSNVVTATTNIASGNLPIGNAAKGLTDSGVLLTALATKSGAEDITLKRIALREGQLSASTGTVTAPDASLAGKEVYYRLDISGNIVIPIPTGAAVPWQKMLFVLKSAVPRTVTFTTGTNGFAPNAGYSLPITTTGDGTVEDYYGFVWNPTLSKWVFNATSRFTGILPFLAGGFGVLPGSDDQIMVSDSATTGTWRTLTDCTGAGKAMTYVAATNTFGCNTISGGGGTGTLQLPVGAINYPASNPAVVEYSAITGKLIFDASTDRCAVWEFYMPADYTGSPVVKFPYSMLSATSGGVSMEMSFWAHTPGDAASIDTEDYATVNNCDDAAVPGTVGRVDVISCTIANDDGAVANDLMHLKICRDANDATNDTATGDMLGRMPALQYAR